MFIHLSEEEIKLLEYNNMADQISRWETIEKAKSFYNKVDGKFTAYKEDEQFLSAAFSTPVKVFQLKC